MFGIFQTTLCVYLNFLAGRKNTYFYNLGGLQVYLTVICAETPDAVWKGGSHRKGEDEQMDRQTEYAYCGPSTF